VIGGGNDIPLVSPKTPPKVQISFHGKSSPGCERLPTKLSAMAQSHIPALMDQQTIMPDAEAEDALAALERFVVEKDDLFQLEESIGRFNIFDALNVGCVEIRHSSFLAWLLDPADSH
jgi:hypothetical protein